MLRQEPLKIVKTKIGDFWRTYISDFLIHIEPEIKLKGRFPKADPYQADPVEDQP